jgi:fibro-slime domain-containing protein
MVWENLGSRGRAPRSALALLMLGVLVHCSSSKTASDDEDGYGNEGGEGASTGGKAGRGGGSSGGTGAAGGQGGAAGSSAGKSGTGGGTGGSDGGETGDAGMGGASPRCGDGVPDAGEGCDDGNTQSGDGCSAVCMTESSCEPTDPECTPTCGDGVLTPPEACDDRNVVGMDGCSAGCDLIEDGFSCPTPGAACTQGAACGNGAVEGAEACDDGGTVPMDGCSGSCAIEDGFACTGSPSVCVSNNCGNGMTETGEGCDDGNSTPLDGCSPECQVEPGCDEDGCTSPCGDGIIVNEACDDGNTRNGDGCSSTCSVESGFTCNAATCDRIAGRCVLRVPAVFRDFNATASAGGHPDFAPAANNLSAIQGLLLDDLDADGKPQLAAPSTAAFLHSVESFSQWYRDTPGVNATVPGEIVLWFNDAGTYANRWGASGERWKAPTKYTNVSYGGPAGTGCTSCTPEAGESCFDPCPAVLDYTNSCCALVETPEYDGNPLFFPIDSAPGVLNDVRSEGKVPPSYGFTSWTWEGDVATALGVMQPMPTATAPFPSLMHNFHFTTEVRFFFRYELGRSVWLDFMGDDDLWVFLNGKLAVDLGAWHVPLNGSLYIPGDTQETITSSATLSDGGVPVTVTRDAAYYGLVPGQLASIAIFHAERQKEGSSFRLGIQGIDVGRSVCVETM